MNNTALRAEAQSANNTHMVFANEEHEKFPPVRLNFGVTDPCLFRQGYYYTLATDGL